MCLQAYHELFNDEEDDTFATALFERLDIQHDDKIDYVSFVDNIKLADIPALTSHCRNAGPLKDVRSRCSLLPFLDLLLVSVHLIRCGGTCGQRVSVSAATPVVGQCC